MILEAVLAGGAGAMVGSSLGVLLMLLFPPYRAEWRFVLKVSAALLLVSAVFAGVLVAVVNR